MNLLSGYGSDDDAGSSSAEVKKPASSGLGSMAVVDSAPMVTYEAVSALEAVTVMPLFRQARLAAACLNGLTNSASG
jgi:hypothetical protein